MSDFSIGEIRMILISLAGITFFNILVRAFVPDEEILGDDAEEMAEAVAFDVQFDVPEFLTLSEAQVQAEGTTFLPDTAVAAVIYLFNNAAGVIRLFIEVVTTGIEILVWFASFTFFQAQLMFGAWQWVFDVAPAATLTVILIMVIPIGFFTFNAGAKIMMVVKDLIPFT